MANRIDALRAPLFVAWQLTRDCDLCCLHCCTESAPGKRLPDELAAFEAMGYGKLPVCVAKTQFSFTTNPDLKGAPEDHIIPVREVRLSAGAEFVVAICGDIMTMPGLPKVPAADSIDVGADGKIVGLF